MSANAVGIDVLGFGGFTMFASRTSRSTETSPIAADRSSFVMSSADPLARPRVRGLCTLAVPEPPQTCALEHARSDRRRRRLVERLIAQHPDEHAEQAIGDAPHRTRVVGAAGS